MIEKIRKIVESLGYPFFFGTRDEVYAYINRVLQCVAVYRQGNATGASQLLVFKFKGEHPQKMYYDVFADLKKVLTIGVQRTFFYDDVLEVRCPVMNKVFIGGGVRPTPPTPVGNNYMYFEAAEGNSTVSLMSMLATAPNLEYSTDGETWQEWQHTTADGVHTFDTLTLTNIGDRVYMRGDNPNGFADFLTEKLSYFSTTGKINAGGNIMSIIEKTMVTSVVPDFGFTLIFSGNTALLTPPAMDTIISIGDGGCASMYSSCTSITSAANMPKLTFIDITGCSAMYDGCISLISASDMPSLTAIGEYGCDGMYAGCISLVSAANMPALTAIGGAGCRSMYIRCTFAMSSNGTTLNFAFPTPPVTAGSITYNTDYDLADWMGNTNGFTNP